jgi:hypothetical protein
MKTNLIKTKPDFHPVCLEATFESQQELNLFMSALRYNETISKLVSKSSAEREQIAEILITMLEALEG